MVELNSNEAVEGAAIEWVLHLERGAGRQPRDIRRGGVVGDVVSPPRLIEVKASGRSARGQDLWLEVSQMEEARRNPDFYLYVVENVRQGNPAKFTLRVLGGGELQRLLARAKEQRHYTVPWPTASYDSVGLGLR